MARIVRKIKGKCVLVGERATKAFTDTVNFTVLAQQVRSSCSLGIRTADGKSMNEIVADALDQMGCTVDMLEQTRREIEELKHDNKKMLTALSEYATKPNV